MHNVSMRAQRDREAQTVLIGTALGMVALIMTAEVLGLLLAHAVLGLGINDTMIDWTFLIAGTLAAVNLIRSEKG